MTLLSQHDLATVFVALAILLGSAKLLGELARVLRQSSILGEISAGVLLGPSVLGRYRPDWYGALFPSTGSIAIVLGAVATLGAVFFLLAAGLETSLRSIFRQRRRAFFVSLLGLVFPFAIGFLAGDLFPSFLGAESGVNHSTFALFIGTALSISALPVIAKILLDLGLLRSEIGAIVLCSAMFDDLVGWMLFGVLLGMIGAGSGSVLRTIVLVVLFVCITLTFGRWLIGKILRFIRSATASSGALLGFIFATTLAAAGFSEFAGIHAIFGAFIVAVAIGNSIELDATREIRHLVTNVFAPFFFASIGVRTDFVANFSLGLTLTIIGLACLGKVLGAWWGARLGKMDARSSWAVAVAMNSRGAMEIILGVLALACKLISERTYVGLVVMALFTSLISAPLIKILLGLGAPTSDTTSLVYGQQGRGALNGRARAGER